MANIRKLLSRSSGYDPDEDILLCQTYLEISQDPIVGKYQTKDVFWSRVEVEYNKSKDPEHDVRNKRSLQCRIQIIEKAVRKLKACIRQVENTNPSGASERDIIERGKRLLIEDTTYKKGFKFDHVWHIMKDFEKFNDNITMGRQESRRNHSSYVSSESDFANSEPNTPTSGGLPSFSINLNDDDDVGGDSPCERPIGVKKAKLKRKIEERKTNEFNNLTEQNEKLMKMMEKTDADRQRYFAMKEQRRDDKMLCMDLSILEPNIRAHIQAQQAIIIQKRAEQYHQSQPPSGSFFGQFLGSFGGDGSDNLGGDGPGNIGGDGTSNFGGYGSGNYSGNGSGNFGGDGSGMPDY